MSRRIKMKNRLFVVGTVVLVLVFGMTVVGCKNDSADKEIDASLIGKWEWQAIKDSEKWNNLPYVIGGVTIMRTGGYVFTSNSLTSYQDGKVEGSLQGVYTENNTIYIQDGRAGYTYSISGNILTALVADEPSIGVRAKKVTKFSWE
jgi:hypothetical protein